MDIILNRLVATIESVKSSENLSQVSAKCGDVLFGCVVLETSDSTPYLKHGEMIELLFKETEVAIAVGLQGEISMSNQIPATIELIEKHPVLTILHLRHEAFQIKSIITTASAERLKLREGSTVTALIKANEISIMEYHGTV